MTTFDAFGNPVWVTVSAGLQAMEADVYGDGIYDPALAAYYLRARHHSPALGRFAEIDIHAGQAQNPAQLRRFGYAGQVAVDGADPG